MIPIHATILPIAVQIVIDDVGWWGGQNSKPHGGPSRTHMPPGRNHCLADYHNVHNLGLQTGMRPQCPFIIGEWDVDNILRDVPGATPQGKHWDNPFKNHPDIPAAAKLLRENNHKTFEIALHGLLHEFWPPLPDGTARPMDRSEWHSTDGTPRTHTWDSHLAAWQTIWDRHNFGLHTPDAFVPPAARHRFGSGFGKRLSAFGIRWINTNLHATRQNHPLNHALFGIDDGVYMIERYPDFAPYAQLAAPPLPGLRQPFLGCHWTNLLHENPDKNHEVVDAWIQALTWYQRDTHTMLAHSTQQCGSQFLYRTLVNAWPETTHAELDFTTFNKLALPFVDDTFILRVTLDKPCTAVTPSSPFKLISQKPFRDDIHDLTLQRLTRSDRATLALI